MKPLANDLTAVVRTVWPMIIGCIVAQLVDIGMPEEAATAFMGAVFYVAAYGAQRLMPNSPIARYLLLAPGRPMYKPSPPGKA